MPSQDGLTLDDVNGESLIGEVEAGSHPCNASSDDKSAVGDRYWGDVKRLDQPRLGDGHSYQFLRFGRCRLRLVHMHPRALIANVRHLEQVRVQASLADRVAEQRLVRPRRARCHDDSIEAVLPDQFLDSVLRIAGAGIEVMFCIHNPGQRLGELNGRGHVKIAADVSPAVTDEDTNSRALSAHVFLRRVLLLSDQRVPRLREEGHRLSRGPRSVGHAFGNVFRLREGAAHEHARPRGFNRAESTRRGESMSVDVNANSLSERTDVGVGFKAGREDHKIEVIMHGMSLLIDKLNPEITGLVDKFHGRRPTANEPDTQLFGALVVGIEALAERAKIHEEDRALQARLVFHGDDRLFGRVHAADRRAVVVLFIARANALHEGDPLGVLPVGRAKHLALVRTTRRENPLKLKARHHVGQPGGSQLDPLIRIVERETRGKDDGSDLETDGRILHFVVDRIGLARFDALKTFGAYGAVQATACLTHRLFLGVAQLHLRESLHALLNRQDGHGNSRLPDVGTLRYGCRRILRAWRAEIFAAFAEILAVKETIDRFRCSLAGDDGLNHDVRPCDHVSPSEDTLHAGDHRLPVGRDEATFGFQDPVGTLEEAPIHRLSDSDDNGVCRMGLL